MNQSYPNPVDQFFLAFDDPFDSKALELFMNAVKE
jgi:hypothetical protein